MNRPLNADEPPSLCPDRTCRRPGLRLFRDRRGGRDRPGPHPPLRHSLPYRRRHIPRPHYPHLPCRLVHQLETPNRGLANRCRLRSHRDAGSRPWLPLDPKNPGTLCPTCLLSLPSLRRLEIVDKIAAPLGPTITSCPHFLPQVCFPRLPRGAIGSTPHSECGCSRFES